MNTRHADTRQHILETGQRIVACKGFSSVGLNELLQAAEVPKGSFYHYFKSKELFGQAVLEAYFEGYLGQIDRLFATPGLSARKRLLAYLRQWQHSQSGASDDAKCLVVKLGAEVADLSEAMRLTLRDGTTRIIDRLARCIADGAVDGSLPALEPLATARTLYQLWLGASLLAKLSRDDNPLAQAWESSLTLLSA